MASGTLVFTALFDDVKYIPVQINGDIADEWTQPLTYHQDEVFFVQLSNPSANATIEKGRATITLVDDDRMMPGVQFLSAVDGGGAVNKLQWRVPAAPVQPTDILVRWNQGVGCASPVNAGVAVNGGQFYLTANFFIPVAGPGQTQSFPHAGLPLVPHCYSVFTIYGGPPTAEPMSVKATPFDGTLGSLKWSYSPGCYPPCAAATLAPPTVGFDAIYTVDNDGVLHAMQRGVTGGPWPTTWNPLSLGKPTQSRSAAVPMKVAPLGDWRLFVGTDGGGVHAVDAKDGVLVWSRSAAFSNALPSNGGAQAAPAGLFKSFNGTNDMLLVGTNDVSNQFLALDPKTGNTISSYPDATMGFVMGMAAVDYAANRVYFGTTAPSATLFALDLGPGGAPSLTLSTLPGGNPQSLLPGTDGAPVLRGNRLYFGTTSSQVYAHDFPTGNNYSTNTGDGQAKGFLWPDRRDDRLYFATNGQVNAVRDTGIALNPLWSVPVVTPSMVLQWPGTDLLYVGDGLGRLVQIKINDQSSSGLVLEAGSQIGPPSLDGANGMAIVGSASGTVYAVRVPLP